MKTIKLTCLDGTFVYISTNHIGHLYEVPEKVEFGVVKVQAHTRIGVTTHNNGGFIVVEKVEQIIKSIREIEQIIKLIEDVQ